MFIGWMLRRFPPNLRNQWYGYRTATSQRSEEVWDFAQGYAAMMMQRLGLLYVIVSSVARWLPTSLEWIGFLALVFFIISMISVLVHIEQKLKREFPL
ncbi:MAG: hypothetical protein RLZZ262_400 [Bacteroidota bacterium]